MFSSSLLPLHFGGVVLVNTGTFGQVRNVVAAAGDVCGHSPHVGAMECMLTALQP